MSGEPLRATGQAAARRSMTARARALTIDAVRGGDPLRLVSADDFRWTEGGPVDPEVVLTDPRLSPFAVDARRRWLLFVELPDDVDLADAPFVYPAQRQRARRLVALDWDVAIELAERAGDRWQRLVVVHSVGRCGSTLLTRALGRLPAVRALSEPDLPTQLLDLDLDPVDARRLLVATTRLLWTGARAGQTHLVLKLRSQCALHARALAEAFPGVSSIFVQRDPHAVVRSGLRAFGYQGSPLWLFGQLCRPVLRQLVLPFALRRQLPQLERLAPLAARIPRRDWGRLGPAGLLTISWLSSVDAIGSAGVAVHSLDYDDLVARPEASLAALLAHCALPPEQASQAASALSEDAQAGSVLARGPRGPRDLSARERAVVDELLERFANVREV